MSDDCKYVAKRIVRTRYGSSNSELTIPSDLSYHLKCNTFQAILLQSGIFYAYVGDTRNKPVDKKNKDDDFYDFSDNILADLLKEGFKGKELIDEFKKRNKLIEEKLEDILTNIDEDDLEVLDKQDALNIFGLN